MQNFFAFSLQSSYRWRCLLFYKTQFKLARFSSLSEALPRDPIVRFAELMSRKKNLKSNIEKLSVRWHHSARGSGQAFLPFFFLFFPQDPTGTGHLKLIVSVFSASSGNIADGVRQPPPTTVPDDCWVGWFLSALLYSSLDTL